MTQYEIKTRSIPCNDSYDVIVAGGGPAGCTAAAAAAREGARTLLIESTGALGGMGTVGLVPAWCPFSDKAGTVIYSGLAEKVFRESKKGVPHVPADALDWIAINPEQLKRVYDDLVTQAGADVLFHTFVSAIETDTPGHAAALIVSNKAGLTAYRAKVFVDCTGDADLAAWAGAEFHKGDDKTGELQPSTHCFMFSNVDDYAFQHLRGVYGGGSDSPMARILNSGKFPQIQDRHLCSSLIGPGTVGFNAGHLWDVDNTNPLSTSAAMIQGRKIAAAYRDALAEFLPSIYGNAMLAATGTLMGCRETRRIVGDYSLTIDDYLERRTFADEICRNNYWIDIHTAKNEIQRNRAGEDVVGKRFEHYGPGESHGIPYRCLTPKGLTNVITAGRAISCDRAVQASVRVMPVCLAMGEAAGMAAAIAAGSAKSDMHAVDTAVLRRRLREEGAYLPE